MRCDICPRNHRQVPADGPLDAKVFCIGEAPGYDEDQGGRPFIGRAGREFNEHYLRLAGLSRDDVYITNTVQCRPDQNRKPYPREVWGCAPNHIPHELKRVDPEVVVLMGGTACSLLERFGGKPDLEAEHGIPQQRELFGWRGWVVPMFHPAAGLHDTAMMRPLMEDWTLLGEWLNAQDQYVESWPWVREDRSKKDYRLLDSKPEVDFYLHQHGELFEMYGADTESHAGKPFSVQISLATGTGALVYWKNQEVVRYLGYTLDGLCSIPVFHYAPADLPMFEQITNVTGYRDTLQEAYGLLLPQALKTLSRRLLGRKRLSWEETVIPPSRRELARWMRQALRHAEGHWQTEVARFHKKTGKPLKPVVTMSRSEKLLPELYAHMMNNPDYAIWEKLKERMPEAELEKLIEYLGPYPVKGVAHLSVEELINYGCSDADDTLTLAKLFERMRKEFVVKLQFQEEDRDK